MRAALPADARRAAWVGTMRAPLSATLAIGALAACASSTPDVWDEPADYTYDATITVFGPTAGQWRITVRGHDVVEIEALDDVARFAAAEWNVPPEDFRTFAEYEQMHAEAERSGAVVADLRRDDSGALRSLEIDMDATTADDEYQVVVDEVSVP